jgi:RNA polymerase-binding transcription factor DksA
MTHTELESYRRQLLARQSLRATDASHLPGQGSAKSSDEVSGSLSYVQMADRRADSFKQEFRQEVAAALKRIEQGTFGCCEECQKPIPQARLEVLPYARHCVDCLWKLQGKTVERQPRRGSELAGLAVNHGPDKPNWAI